MRESLRLCRPMLVLFEVPARMLHWAVVVGHETSSPDNLLLLNSNGALYRMSIGTLRQRMDLGNHITSRLPIISDRIGRFNSISCTWGEPPVDPSATRNYVSCPSSSSAPRQCQLLPATALALITRHIPASPCAVLGLLTHWLHVSSACLLAYWLQPAALDDLCWWQGNIHAKLRGNHSGAFNIADTVLGHPGALLLPVGLGWRIFRGLGKHG